MKKQYLLKLTYLIQDHLLSVPLKMSKTLQTQSIVSQTYPRMLYPNLSTFFLVGIYLDLIFQEEQFIIWIFNLKTPLLNEHSIGMIVFLFEWKIKKHTCIFLFFQMNEWKLISFFTPVSIGDKKTVNLFKCH